MKFATKCPYCENVLAVSLKHVTWTIKCRHCARQFIPVEDSGLACPKCGEITMMTIRDIGPGISCLGCGFVFKRRSIWRRGYYALPVSIGVGVLILLISLFSINHILHRHRKANEAMAISVLRTLSSAQELFNILNGRYAPTLAALANAGMVDGVTANAIFPKRAKAGYYFILNLTPTGWECVAMPAEPGGTGMRSFYIRQDGVIYHAPCNSENDPPASPSYIGEPLGIKWQ